MKIQNRNFHTVIDCEYVFVSIVLCIAKLTAVQDMVRARARAYTSDRAK